MLMEEREFDRGREQFQKLEQVNPSNPDIALAIGLYLPSWMTWGVQKSISNVHCNSGLRTPTQFISIWGVSMKLHSTMLKQWMPTSG